MIYFDNNATTRPAPAVAAAMTDALETFGNPSSAHLAGRKARRVISDAREKVAALLGAANAEEVIFTSGGSESDALAIMGAVNARNEKGTVITTAVEHEAVLKTADPLSAAGYKVIRIGVNAEGDLDLAQLAAELSDDTAVVSVMMANNETGVIFPVGEIAEMVKSRTKALFHVDGVNAVGKIPVDLKNTAIDLFSISAHKFHGPKGVGALYLKSGTEISPQIRGGGQEFGIRAGTEPVHQIAGLAAAAELVSDMSPMGRVREYRDRLEAGILRLIPGASVNGANAADRLPNTSNISFENVNGEMILSGLDDSGICVSTGSACNSGRVSASHVLTAMSVPFSRVIGSIRFSLGRMNKADEIDLLLDTLPELITRLSGSGPGN